VEYVCLQVLPVLADVGGSAGSDVQLDLLKLLAEMAGHCGEFSSVEQCTANIFACLLVSYCLLTVFFVVMVTFKDVYISCFDTAKHENKHLFCKKKLE